MELHTLMNPSTTLNIVHLGTLANVGIPLASNISAGYVLGLARGYCSKSGFHRRIILKCSKIFENCNLYLQLDENVCWSDEDIPGKN